MLDNNTVSIIAHGSTTCWSLSNLASLLQRSLTRQRKAWCGKLLYLKGDELYFYNPKTLEAKFVYRISEQHPMLAETSQLRNGNIFVAIKNRISIIDTDTNQVRKLDLSNIIKNPIYSYYELRDGSMALCYQNGVGVLDLDTFYLDIKPLQSVNIVQLRDERIVALTYTTLHIFDKHWNRVQKHPVEQQYILKISAGKGRRLVCQKNSSFFTMDVDTLESTKEQRSGKRDFKLTQLSNGKIISWPTMVLYNEEREEKQLPVSIFTAHMSPQTLLEIDGNTIAYEDSKNDIIVCDLTTGSVRERYRGMPNADFRAFIIE
jgi:hypothetical protein